MIEVGELAPAFNLPADGDRVIDSASLAGKPYVIYFYPRDNTPGCTTEACDFRDNFARVQAKGFEVFGVSKDTVKSHDKFVAKFELPFALLADTDKTLMKAYGAWGKKKMYGKEVEGTIRSTFIIGSDGKVVAAWPKVRAKGHVDKVIEALEAM